MFLRSFSRRIRFPTLRLFSSKSQSTTSEAKERISRSKSHLLHSLVGMSDEQIVALVKEGKVSQYNLEKALKKAVEAGEHPDCERAVRVRRTFVKTELDSTSDVMVTNASLKRFSGLPFTQFDYETFYKEVLGTNCENVIGYVPIPVGFAGPLLINGKKVFVPMATTEGALVASTHRGCRAITESGGCRSFLIRDGMTRAPVVRLPSVERAVELHHWLERPENFQRLKIAFEATTRFGKLESAKPTVAGQNVFIRFCAATGDAMGMNILSKGVLEAMKVIEEAFPEVELVSVSGNLCTDKKPAAVNWILGRGKSVSCEVTLTGHVIVSVLKCTVESLVELNVSKNLVGSALAGSIGGNNAHASNIVTACFLATGQDPAQVVESSNCMTLMEPVNEGKDLHVSVTMPSLEVGTVGGGTGLTSQRACLQLLGVAGAHPDTSGANAAELAKIICGTVLAGEISLMSALASNHLVSAHMKLNRPLAPPTDHDASDGHINM